MGMPNIPDMRPKIDLCKCDAINALLHSIALEEIALSHILNAEGEKIQKAVLLSKHLEELLCINQNTVKLLKTVLSTELVLLMKLENIQDIKGISGNCNCDCDDCCEE
ncbi:MAG: hypothetical protein K0S34_2089 [Bacillales bacterium]|jgi:hypothetical protein|nr:hypothetical protein [Bacillales bacterium]